MNDAPREFAEESADRGVLNYWGARVAGLMAMFQFVGLAMSALFWWWSMPGGFPVTHPRFAMNQLVPFCFAALGVVAVFAGMRSRPVWLRGCQLFLLGTMIVAGVVGACLYPRSMMGVRLLFVVSVVLFGVVIVSVLIFRFIPRAPVPHWVFLPAILLGTFMPWSQRGLDAATRPIDRLLPEVQFAEQDNHRKPLSLSKHFGVQPTSGAVVARRGNLTLLAEPLLTFISTSPDRFWTLFSPHRPAANRLTTSRSGSNAFVAEYFGDYRSQLQASVTNETLHIDARSELKAPIYSHLNSYVNLQFHADQPIAVSFSPCPERVAVLPSDYPVGRPARFACLKAGGVFEVVEASSGEKGPFNALTSGKLPAGEPLVLTLFNGDEAVFAITFNDWSKQASTQLSPTAGWGMPENAIEFSISESGTVAMIYLTLAGTSVGRGWDSVGHAPGVYRNRMTVRVFGGE